MGSCIMAGSPQAEENTVCIQALAGATVGCQQERALLRSLVVLLVFCLLGIVYCVFFIVLCIVHGVHVLFTDSCHPCTKHFSSIVCYFRNDKRLTLTWPGGQRKDNDRIWGGVLKAPVNCPCRATHARGGKKRAARHSKNEPACFEE